MGRKEKLIKELKKRPKTYESAHQWRKGVE